MYSSLFVANVPSRCVVKKDVYAVVLNSVYAMQLLGAISYDIVYTDGRVAAAEGTNITTPRYQIENFNSSRPFKKSSDRPRPAALTKHAPQNPHQRLELLKRSKMAATLVHLLKHHLP